MLLDHCHVTQPKQTNVQTNQTTNKLTIYYTTIILLQFSYLYSEGSHRVTTVDIRRIEFKTLNPTYTYTVSLLLTTWMK